MSRFSFSALRRLAVASLAAVLLAPSTPTAGPIDPGFDLLTTLPGTFANLGPLGIVQFKGIPIGPGNTDTIVRRIGATTPGFDFGSPQETIPIEIVALSLVSIAPVELAPGSFFDVFVTLDGPQATGSMTLTHEFSDGGTFDAHLPVNALLTFSEVGNPGNIVINSFFDVFVSLDVPWSHDPPPQDRHNAQYPAGGLHVTGPFTEAAQLAQHRVGPAVPAPGTLALAGLGLGLLAWSSRKRNRP